MLKIRRPLGRLIFNMGIAIPGKTVFLIETAPWALDTMRSHQPYWMASFSLQRWRVKGLLKFCILLRKFVCYFAQNEIHYPICIIFAKKYWNLSKNTQMLALFCEVSFYGPFLSAFYLLMASFLSEKMSQLVCQHFTCWWPLFSQHFTCWWPLLGQHFTCGWPVFCQHYTCW